jgi:RimJ/RimL family protein N-acetyltransferase
MPFDADALDLTGRPYVREGLRLRPLEPAADIAVMHRWLTAERAKFWGMQHRTEAEIRAYYAALQDSGHGLAFAGDFRGAPAFLVECYDPRHDELGRHYPVRRGDVGMHFFVGPPTVPLPGFSRRVFRTLMTFVFERLQARRVVVEPDVRNARVHVLNREMGFVYQRYVQLPHKTAALAFCTRERFVLSQREEQAA